MNENYQKLIWQICYNGYKIKETNEKFDFVTYKKIIGEVEHCIGIYPNGKLSMYSKSAGRITTAAYQTGLLTEINPEQLKILIIVFHQNYK